MFNDRVLAATLHHLLVVEDDDRWRKELCDWLHGYGYAISTASDAVAMRAVLASTRVDAILLDATLPASDGVSLCRELRLKSDVPIILMAGFDNVEQRIAAIEAGADDYVVKPINTREVIGRVKAILRRSSRSATDAGYRSPQTYRFGEWRLEPRAHKLQHSDGSTQLLTRAEVEMLSLLVMNPHVLISKARLSHLLYGHGTSQSRAVDVRVSRMRRLLRQQPGSPEMIRTVYARGYMFMEQVTHD